MEDDGSLPFAREAAFNFEFIRPSVQESFELLSDPEAATVVRDTILAAQAEAETTSGFTTRFLGRLAVGTVVEKIKNFSSLFGGQEPAPGNTDEAVELPSSIFEVPPSYSPEDIDGLSAPLDRFITPASPPEPAPVTSEAAKEARRRGLSNKIMNSNLVRSLLPVVDALRGHSVYGRAVNNQLFADPQGYGDVAGRYLVSADVLQRQRPLSAAETQYIRSVEELSSANPYVVAAGAAAPEITNVCLDAEFARRDAKTRETYPSGSYVPLAVAGFGVHGTIAAGELLRLRPDLTANAVFLGKEKQPGGVFGMANGAAHSLNSANYVGGEPFTLPNEADANILREMAGLFPQYPGERTDPTKGRTGSINRLVPFMPAPDELDKRTRYLNNWQLALMVKEQAALTMFNIMGEVGLTSVELNEDGGPGLYKLTMNDLREDASENYVLYTDGLLLTTGLGEPRRAVANDNRLQQLLELQKDKPGLPYYTDAVTAYNYFADRTKDKLEHGRSIAIIGNGDSAATLAEGLGGLFEPGNLGDIDEIYIIAEADPSCRPRYAAIADLLERRTGRKNILRYIEKRVSAVTASNPYGIAGDDPLYEGINLLDQDDILINKGRNLDTLGVDHVIDATGFTPELDKVLRPLTNRPLESATQDITLPGIFGVSVGRQLTNHPRVALLGTASKLQPTNEKRALYPDTTRTVLDQISQNIVSVGLLGPDTTAGVGVWAQETLSSIPEQPVDMEVMGKTLSRETSGEATVTQTMQLADVPLPAMDRHVTIDDALLTPLLLAPLAIHRLDTPRMQAGSDTAPSETTSTYNARVQYAGDSVQVTAPGSVPTAVVEELTVAASNGHFRVYATEALRRRRDAETVQVRIQYKNGRLSLANSFVQPV